VTKPEVVWSRDLIYRMRLMGTRIPDNINTLGLEMTTLFEFFDIAFGPLMGCQEKFCFIRTCDGQKHYSGVVLHKLLYKRHVGHSPPVAK